MFLRGGNAANWIVLAAFFYMLNAAYGAPTSVSGKPVITDGDTYKFENGVIVRLFGVDTPEKYQKCERKGSCYPCGLEATDKIRDFVGGGEMSCQFTGDRTYGRYVGICAVNGSDVGEMLINTGWGIPYRRYLEGHSLENVYLQAEEFAKRERLGMHEGRFVPPQSWRSQKMRLQCER